MNSMIDGGLEKCTKAAVGVHAEGGFQDNTIEESLYVHGGTVEDDGDSITKCIFIVELLMWQQIWAEALGQNGNCFIGHEVNTDPKCCISLSLSPPDSSPSVPPGYELCTFSHGEHGPLGGEFAPISPSKG